MKAIKIFLAGMAFPTLLLPIILIVALSLGKKEILSVTFLHFIPLIWGVWNLLYFAIFTKVFPGNENTKLLITGALLGFFVTVVGVFGFNLPAVIGLPECYTYMPLILGPIVYALLWVFIVKPLNHLLHVTH